MLCTSLLSASSKPHLKRQPTHPQPTLSHWNYQNIMMYVTNTFYLKERFSLLIVTSISCHRSEVLKLLCYLFHFAMKSISPTLQPQTQGSFHVLNCRIYQIPEFTSAVSIPQALWVTPWPPPLGLISYRNNPVSGFGFWVASHMTVWLEVAVTYYAGINVKLVPLSGC